MRFAKILNKLDAVLLLASLCFQVAQAKPSPISATESHMDEQPVSVTANFEAAPSSSSSSSPTSQLQDDPIRAIHYHFDQEMEPFMHLHKFAPSSSSSSSSSSATDSSTDGNNVTCNDGSPAGYYKRLNNHSKSWIIYLQGGGYCGSEEACQLRWRRSAHLMSSSFWPQSMSCKLCNGSCEKLNRANHRSARAPPDREAPLCGGPGPSWLAVVARAL